MDIIYTKHAEEMIGFRKIKKKQVEDCIKNPDKILSVKEGKKAYLKDFGKNFLKIIVSEEDYAVIIITCYWIAKKRTKE